MKIYMIRHGKTDWNERGLIQGMSDIPLNEEGKRQAFNVAEKLKDVKFDLCISSPLERAFQTAKIITQDRCDIIFDDLLLERGMGLLEGKPHELYKKFDYYNYKKNSHENEVEGIQELLKRTKLFLKKIRENYGSKTLLIVSHAATIRALHFNINGY